MRFFRVYGIPTWALIFLMVEGSRTPTSVGLFPAQRGHRALCFERRRLENIKLFVAEYFGRFLYCIVISINPWPSAGPRFIVVERVLSLMFSLLVKTDHDSTSSSTRR